MKASSEIILSAKNLKSNWEFLRSYFGDILISAVVKGNAYGHGIRTYVPLAEECGVNHFSVYNAHEAYEVFDAASKGTTIMIMGDMDEDDIDWAIAHNIEFFVFNMERLDYAIEASKRLDKKAIIHIEAETGMYRTGFAATDLNEVREKIKENRSSIHFKGLCMHFAGAESISNYVRLKQQKITFKKILKKFEQEDLKPEQVHTCCSAASIRFPDMRYDMLRIGIMQYGFWPSPEIMVEYMNEKDTQESPLKRIITWKSKVMGIKHVPAGGFIGYGSSYFAHTKMKTAIVPVGYAHGFARALSNAGIALVNEWRVPVVGLVNMNCIVLDVTQTPEEVKINDDVVLIGTQGQYEISVASFGEMSSQLNYELLTRLPHYIPRRVEY